MVYSFSDLLNTLLFAGVNGGPGVEVEQSETQNTAASEFINQHGLALTKHVWVVKKSTATQKTAP